MCGIVGVVTPSGAAAKTVTGLGCLEYRGYDSAGLAWIEDERLRVYRSAGKMDRFRESLPPVPDSVPAAIGHLRWATHGAPTVRNAHPQADAASLLALVHNGIIDNADALKAELEADGVLFTSDTDTEVAVQLLARAYRATGDLVQAMARTMKRLDGTFAFGVMAADRPDMVVGARRGSPLAASAFESGGMIASDALPMLPHTRRVWYLADDQIARLTPAGLEGFDADGQSIAPEFTDIDWSAEAASKGGYAHFMLKEIHEQPQVLENMVRTRIKLPESGQPVYQLDDLRLDESLLRGIARIVLISQGTSHHAAMIGRNMIERVARIPTATEYAADFRYRDPLLDPTVLVAAISQSGETADTLAALRLAKERGCPTLALVNVVGSAIAREADGVFHLHCGAEIGVASTKAFTSMIAGLYITALRMGQILGTLDCAEQRRRTADLLGVGARLEGVLETANYIRRIAVKYKDASNFLFLGRGTGWPLALEGALKLKEVSYIHAEGYDAAEMKHGPIALIDEHMPTCFIAIQGGRRYQKVLGNMMEIKARQGRIIAIASHDDDGIDRVADDVIYVRAESGIMNSIVCAIPLQLLAYYISVLRGNDVDKPKNLAKSVTVE